MRLAADYATDEDRRAFEDWCAERPDRRGRYEEARKISDLCEGLMYAPRLADRLSATGRRERPSPRRHRHASAVLGVLAVSAFLFLVGARLLPWTAPSEIFSTTVGERSKVALNDGSIVELNTNSTIRVTLSAGRRDVTLAKGEAFFSVAQDKRRPFIVDVGAGRVEVTGTRFNVRRESEAVTVSLLEGSVVMSATPAAAPADPAGRRAEVRLRPGEAGVLHPSGAIEVAALPQGGGQASWREGKLRFYDAPLSDVIAEFNRYSSVRLVIVDRDLRTRTLSGVFRIGDRDALLFALQAHLGVRAETAGAEIRLVGGSAAPP